MQQYASVIVNISHESVDRPFTYRIPNRLLGRIEVGNCVKVPFGKGDKFIIGYVVSLLDDVLFPKEKLKEIDSIVAGQSAVEGKMIALAAWIREEYGSTMINALKTVLPVKKMVRQKEKKTIELLLKSDQTQIFLEECIKRHQNAKEHLVQELASEKVLDYQLVTQKLHISPATIKSLCAANVIEIKTENYFRNPIIAGRQDTKEEIMLNEEQKKAVAAFTDDYQKGIRKTYLIHGVTGSGKTEVYIRMIREVIREGKQAIVLIPEIALSYQTVLRFYKYFGERVSIMNSSLSAGEKYDQCERARRGEIDIIIGPRSSLFTPFQNLGLIVIDEEHEQTYKNENVPKYHARETAMKLAGMHQASVVLGSATPSVESYYLAKKGIYELLLLKNRALSANLPNVHVVDLRRELREGNRSIFSGKLQELIVDRLQKKEQIMLFLNRRGYAGFISCRACGHVMKCPHCDVSLSEHQNGVLICHYCGYEMIRPKRCPICQSPYLLSFRAGTEQVVEQINRMFPKAAVLRMDRDTTRKKDGYERILSSFSNKEADILVGTQMIVKGHDFPNVTLVGILAADLSLAANDYRAGERTFQLLTQASGRAGRGDKTGEVVIQTYQPDHYSIIHASRQDYEGFYEEELAYRELSLYPPICSILAVLITSKYEKKALDMASEMVRQIREENDLMQNGCRIIGPALAGIGKIQDCFRYVFYIKADEKEKLIRIKNRLEEGDEQKEVSVLFDFDPMNAY